MEKEGNTFILADTAKIKGKTKKSQTFKTFREKLCTQISLKHLKLQREKPYMSKQHRMFSCLDPVADVGDGKQRSQSAEGQSLLRE